MSQGSEQPPKQVEVISKYPWYVQVLDKHGITTVFSLALLYGAWELSKRHFEFLDAQTTQMLHQTKSLETIAHSNIRQEQVLDDVIETLRNGNLEHKHIIEKIK